MAKRAREYRKRKRRGQSMVQIRLDLVEAERLRELRRSFPTGSPRHDMPLPMGDRAFALREIAAAEQALREGYPPPHLVLPGSNVRKTAIRIVAERLGLDPQTLRGHVGDEHNVGRIWKRFEIRVDWEQYRPASAPPPEPPPESPYLEPPAPPPEKPAEAVADLVRSGRLKDELERIRNALEGAERRAAAAEDIRAGVLGLRDMPPAPVSFPVREGSPAQAETVVLLLSERACGAEAD